MTPPDGQQIELDQKKADRKELCDPEYHCGIGITIVVGSRIQTNVESSRLQLFQLPVRFRIFASDFPPVLQPYWIFRPIYGFRTMLYKLAMQRKLSKSTSHPNPWVAGAWPPFGVRGSLHTRHIHNANGHYPTNIGHLDQVQQSKDNCWYTPLWSPAFNDLTRF
jgi:hypothetical protein